MAIGKFTRSETSEHQNLTKAIKAIKKEKQIGARIDEDLFYQAQEFALKQRTAFKNIVEQALKEYLEKHNK